MEATLRPIVTTYYADMKAKKLVRTTQAKWSNNAVLHAVNHMQLNHYEASVCEVYDAQSGTLHAVIVRRPTRDKIEIVFKREVKENM